MSRQKLLEELLKKARIFEDVVRPKCNEDEDVIELIREVDFLVYQIDRLS